MRLDKLAYLGLSVFTLVIIIIVIVLGNYGTNISSDRNFIAFFKWYIKILPISYCKYLIYKISINF